MHNDTTENTTANTAKDTTDNTLTITPESPWLAPLAGWSDLPFRLLCKEEGAKVTCTEMISAKGLVYGGKHTEVLLATCPEDSPVVAQIFGAEHDFMAKGVALLQKKGFQHFDVNVGCSVAKVVKTGAGAALLKDIPNLLKIAEHVIKQVHNPDCKDFDDFGNFGNREDFHEGENPILCNSDGEDFYEGENPILQRKMSFSPSNSPFPEKATKNINTKQCATDSTRNEENKEGIRAGKIGFKIRLGYEMGNDVYIDLAKELEALGADWITLHPRYAKQSFSGVPNYEALTKLKSTIKIPVIASGDLFTAQDGVRILLETGVDGVMYARGAMSNPVIFKEHVLLWNYAQENKLKPSEIPHINDLMPKTTENMRNDLGKLIERHLTYAKEFNPHRALLQMRTIVPRYVKHLENAKALRLAIIACRTHEELKSVLETYFGESL